MDLLTSELETKIQREIFMPAIRGDYALAGKEYRPCLAGTLRQHPGE